MRSSGSSYQNNDSFQLSATERCNWLS